MEKSKGYLDWMVPIRFIGMTWVPLIAIYWLPNPWWGITLKIILGLWILNTLRASFDQMWNEYDHLFAFVVFNNLYLAGILWLQKPSWLIYISSLLIVVAFSVMYKHINDHNKKLRD